MAKERLAIIGSGPAGFTAAIYAARAELAPVLFEGVQDGGQPGGQLMLTTDIENFPGFPKGIKGPELMQLMREQALRFGTKIISEDVTRVDFSQRPFLIESASGIREAQAVIVATGAKAKWLEVHGEKEYQGRGVSACATCDGFFFKGKEIAMVGGGDAALEEAAFLTRFVTFVTLFVRREELRASKIMQERARANPKIRFVWNSEVKEVLGDGRTVTGLSIYNNKTDDTTVFSTQGLFVAIGHEPNTKLFTGQLELDVKGYIVVRNGSTATSVEGVFVAGDVADHKYRQAITAAGTGCMAALDVEQFLG